MRSMNYNEDLFSVYFYFIQERMRILWDRLSGNSMPWTSDPILSSYRFTNVYRATDRISQYLITNVIPGSSEVSERDMVFRIIFFKIFNRIDTWEFVENNFGLLKIENFDVAKISRSLSERQKSGPIFNNAYMMTGTHSKYNNLSSKHEKWLAMVKCELINNDVLESVLKSKSLKEIYNKLRACSFLGDFLAYQYAIDINYSPLFEFDENSFVKAGIGAIRGVKKCFPKINSDEIDETINFTLENFTLLQSKFGYTAFEPIPRRNPTLIDLQNCFCETDKYPPVSGKMTLSTMILGASR